MSTKVHPFSSGTTVQTDLFQVKSQQPKRNEPVSMPGHMIEDKVNLLEPHKPFSSADYLSSVNTREVAKVLLEKVFL